MQTMETTTNSAVFSRKSKIIWKPSLDLDIGMSGLSNITLDHTNHNPYEFARITMEDYILQGVILIIVLLLLLFFYICFWKWVAKGNLDLPKFGGGSQLVFTCFPNRSGLKKTESTQVLGDNQENGMVEEALDDTSSIEENDSTIQINVILTE